MNSLSAVSLAPGQRVRHAALGEGVIVAPPAQGYVRVFFPAGERQVSAESLLRAIGRSRLIAENAAPGERRARRAWLTWQAHALPLLANAATLTSAKIDLLPHQVVITHRIATTSPRRFLIADEVGLGKTIEAALILRELASRGELKRALMVVPAGLVNNWHRELNEVFHLDFEVFGSEGDVTDRKSNAFAKHDHLIASIDTLKRRARIKRLEEAPPWDLVVFDEAHHLAAYRSGGKVKKTENYKLAEVLKGRARDLLLLSGTPHQGDHFRFWMLVQLLDPTLFNSPEEMVKERHRLNAVVFRRTKADACRPDGSQLFARRWVHTESFVMCDAERAFYLGLNEYLRDGFALARRQGSKGTALGFVMTIFQKIAASSFAAVHRTLRRRLIALTVHEGLLHDDNRDIDRRDHTFQEARELIRQEFALGANRMADLEVDAILADLKRRILKKLDEEALAVAADAFGDEVQVAAAEDSAVTAVAQTLPEERMRIRELLAKFPGVLETKVQKLLAALGTLWQQNQGERVVIFATYLGSVEMLGREIERAHPGQGVVVLKGGDHGSKVAAEKRFKEPSGPRVMICTAAGREGLNMQHARVLFNFDLPWNPMDMEQRIGRIHRYGQRHTAQVYNLVLSDTIEGRIFLLLDEKLSEIARALGKVDEAGSVAEDLRSQILGQLSERLSYDRLYAQALSDPELKRTRLELEAAMANASEAQHVVFELFQDLEGFNLDEYKPLADPSAGLSAIESFLRTAVGADGKRLSRSATGSLDLLGAGGECEARFVVDRDEAVASDAVTLIGLDHPVVSGYLARFREQSPEELGIVVGTKLDRPAVLTLWQVTAQTERSQSGTTVVSIAADEAGHRLPSLERHADEAFGWPGAVGRRACFADMLEPIIEPMLHRELVHRGLVRDGQSYQAKLVGWVEAV